MVISVSTGAFSCGIRQKAMPAIDEMLFDLLWPGCPWLFETQFEGSQKGLHAPRNVQLLCNFLPWQKKGRRGQLRIHGTLAAPGTRQSRESGGDGS